MQPTVETVQPAGMVADGTFDIAGRDGLRGLLIGLSGIQNFVNSDRHPVGAGDDCALVSDTLLKPFIAVLKF